jgi:hypothetical protein
VLARHQVEAGRGHLFPEVSGIVPQTRA